MCVQVHMTGDSVNEAMTEFLRYALVWARTHQKEIMALLEVSSRASWLLELEPPLG